MGNKEPWEATGKRPIILKIRIRKWRWVANTMVKGD
jgi:hypothetical protein